MTKRKSKLGGWRPGSGRKPKYGEPTFVSAIRLPVSVVGILDQLAGDQKSRSEVVLELLSKAHKPIRDVLQK